MSSGRSRGVATLVAGALGLGLVGVGAVGPPPPPAAAAPTLRLTEVVGGLEVPWDLTWVGDNLLYTLRTGEVWAKTGTAQPRRLLTAAQTATHASGEGGLLGIVADPAAASNDTFYTCGVNTSPRDVRVRRWVLTGSTVTGGTVVVSGLPWTSGRHSGCRLRFGADGKLYVGTGDAAAGTNPQNLNSLGGKVLRVNANGTIPSDNPFAGRAGNARYVWTYGHRNVQGLALRPGTSEIWSAEHGSDRDDEINKIVRGGNYGWNPVPGYNESVPMTDTKEYPSARRAVWSSGNPTIATSGLTFLSGPAWGRWQGAMAVGILKDHGINIVTLKPDGSLAAVERLGIVGNADRIRTVQQGPDGALYYTTSNGSNDRIMKLTPTPANPLPTYRPGQDVSPVGVAAARTGRSIYLFVRSTDDVVYYKRSTDDGNTWGGWVNTKVTSTSAPAATSFRGGRIDLLTRSSTNSVVLTWFDNGVRRGQSNLGGSATSAPAATVLAAGTMDVFVRGGSPYSAWRNHYGADGWSGWQNLGGTFSSALAASADPSRGTITVAGRASTGVIHQRSVTADSNGSGWPSTGLTTWSGRALADRVGSAPVVGVHLGSDGYTVVDRGRLVQGVGARYDSFPAVVSRSDGSWIMFGRATSTKTAFLYSARAGGYRHVNLGGVVR